MAAFKGHVFGSSVTALFSLLGFVFALVAITSKEWVQRKEYASTIPVQWSKVQYTLYRSPFVICTAQEGNVSCEHFSAYGKHTSCEAAHITGDIDANNTGDARLCEQILLAGHFAIASTTLISVGFLLSIALLVTAILGSRTEAHDSATGGGGKEKQASERVVESGDATVPQPLPSARKSGKAGWSAYGSSLLLACLCVGVMTALLAQFYAVIGLIQSQPNNADFASSSDITDASLRHYDSWYQGRALSTYETCAWGFAALGAVVASRTWRLPQCY